MLAGLERWGVRAQCMQTAWCLEQGKRRRGSKTKSKCPAECRAFVRKQVAGTATAFMLSLPLDASHGHPAVPSAPPLPPPPLALWQLLRRGQPSNSVSSSACSTMCCTHPPFPALTLWQLLHHGEPLRATLSFLARTVVTCLLSRSAAAPLPSHPPPPPLRPHPLAAAAPW